jgi:hypothetical protein
VASCAERPFDFSLQMERLIRDIAGRCPEFSHVDPRRLLVCIAQARNGCSAGIHAQVVPLRFQGGRKTCQFGQWLYRMPTVRRGGREILYAVYFYLPRFQESAFTCKLQIVFHELYHISPKFNGDLRRFPGRKFLHGPSEKAYDRAVSQIMQTYLARPGRNGSADFLRYSFGGLERRFGEVVGYRLRTPVAYRVGRVG